MTVQCDLCPKACIIAPGQSGECRIRVNIDGRLVAVSYGHPCAVHLDPVEKKPIFHFLPGTDILSIATVGCNLHCLNCQNWEISQENPENVAAQELLPEQLIALAQKFGCQSMAYTYTEPLVFYEYTLACSMKAREAGLRNILVTAGYLNEEPLRRLFAYVDGAQIDIKAMSESFYQDVCDASLGPVLNACVLAKEMGLLLEVTNLVIPTLNDSEADLRRLTRWIVSHLGADTPLHFSRFHPQYRMQNLPPTPAEILQLARTIAQEEGLHYVYIGNLSLPDAENTYCPECNALLIERRGFTVINNNLKDGKCFCGKEIYGLWQ
ncbi:MAG: AmmeMemoRadiSam system radical SAM enzyme [Candidatus Hydrogenedentes bacterium]|nr:AmmeMemoRadiSam system radical SAM enzyme [Candidatus Hydrogenedentota bacterium]